MLSKQPNDLVDDNETLYRRIPLGRNCYRYENKELKISSQAFNDRNCQPSVDRADLCQNQPEYAKQDKTDGVVSLLAYDIRSEKIKIDGKEGQEYLLDIVPEPVPDNKAHAIIIPTPEYRNLSNFKKVKERLARLAKWELKPIET